MKVTKEIVGKKVWLVPTGNNVARNKLTPLEQAKEAVITKLARVKGEFNFVGFNRSQKFSLSEYSSKAIDQGCNAGYEIYASFEDVENAKKASKLRSLLIANCRSMSDEQILKIGAILDIE